MISITSMITIVINAFLCFFLNLTFSKLFSLNESSPLIFHLCSLPLLTVTSDPRLSSGPQAQSFNPTMSSQKLANTASSLLSSRQTCLIWTILSIFLDHYSFSSQVHSPVRLLSCHKSKSIQIIAKHMSWNIHYQVYTISTFPKQPCTTWLHNLFPMSGSPFAQFLITEFDIKM